MASVLHTQVQSYGDAALQAAHSGAMECRDAEEFIEIGLALLDVAQRLAAEPLADAAPGAEVRLAAHFDSAFRSIDEGFDATALVIEHLEQEGFEIDGAEQFREAHGSLKAMLTVTAEMVAAAAEDVRQGRVRPAAEVRDALRRRLQRQG